MQSDRPTDGDVTGRVGTARHGTLLVLFLLYACCWLLAVIGISCDMRLPVDERWAASALLVLEGGIAFLWVADSDTWPRAFAFSAVVLPLAFAIEFVGVKTGLPFGRYHYTGALIPTVLGRVPVPITCAWLMIALGSLCTARLIVSRDAPAITPMIAAALATSLDACLEPAAFHVKGYWLWEQPGPYYGVPARNFAGWFIAALLVTACADRVLRRGANVHAPRSLFVPLTLFWSTVAMFAIVDLFRGYPGGAAIGAALCVIVLAAAGRPWRRATRHPPDMPAPSTPDGRAAARRSSSRE